MESWQKQREYGFGNTSSFSNRRRRIRDVALTELYHAIDGHGSLSPSCGRIVYVRQQLGYGEEMEVREISLTQSIDSRTDRTRVVLRNEDEKFQRRVCAAGKFVMLVETNDLRWFTFTFAFPVTW